MTDLDDLLIQRRLDALLEPWRDGGAGVTIGVVLGGALRVHLHAGLANIEHAVPIGPGTRFRIASVSKQFTCAAILMLEAEGALALDAAVRTYLPELPALADQITVAQLMHNTSGIRDMLEIVRHGGGDLGTPIGPQVLFDGIARQRTLNFDPGGRFLYSNSNFLLLGLIVERLSGRSLDAVLQERIFLPLGMRDTRVTPSTAEAIPRLATGYLRGDDGIWARAAHAFPLAGEGGLVSSVADLALWARHFATRCIGAGWLDGLMVQAPFNNGSLNRYGRGLVARPYRGVETWSHGGLWPGYRTEFLLAPGQDVAVIVMANTGNADPSLLAHRVLDVVLGTRPGVHPVPKPLPHDAVAGFSGRYIDDVTDATLDIAVADDDAVTLTMNGIPAVAEATEEGRLASPRASSVFAVRAAGASAIEVEQDAGIIGVWRRAPPTACLPQGLAGTYRSDEMAAEWRITEQDGKATVVASGPIATGPAWDAEPIDGDLIRIYAPGTLYRSWFDVRALRAQGRVCALLASGGRVKRVRYDRVT